MHHCKPPGLHCFAIVFLGAVWHPNISAVNLKSVLFLLQGQSAQRTRAYEVFPDFTSAIQARIPLTPTGEPELSFLTLMPPVSLEHHPTVTSEEYSLQNSLPAFHPE